MAITIYSVTITPYATVDADQGGFIDPQSVTQYGLKPGLTFAQCMDKKRGNMRWNDIVESLSLSANAFIDNITTPGAAVDTAPTSVSFEVSYVAAGNPSIVRDNVVLLGVDAVKQMIAEALITTSFDQCEVFDPTMTDPIDSVYHFQGVIAAHLACGPRFMVLDIGKLANDVTSAKSHISVTIKP